MKSLISITFLAFIIGAIESCKKPPAVTPGSKSETNATTSQTTASQNTTTLLPTLPHGIIVPGVSIIGRWSLVNDSTYSIFQVGDGPVYVSHHNYTGAPGDYYDFGVNGQLSIRHGSFSTDTAGYTLITGDKINIVYTPNTCKTGCTMYLNVGEGMFTITSLTTSQLELGSLVYSPEGPFEEIMTFKK